tara:strand:- start:35 stop:169 length:135 start_codon:yes stop_codon:yes gene_type:complete
MGGGPRDFSIPILSFWPNIRLMNGVGNRKRALFFLTLYLKLLID